VRRRDGCESGSNGRFNSHEQFFNQERTVANESGF
jgi:hypothetical protein